VTGITVRDAAAADTEAISRIAIATGQDEEWGGSDPAYVSHLLAHGRLVVAEYRGAVAGFGDSTPRMTFSSLHAHALPLYARYGLDAWWPLLYLAGDVTALRAPAGWAVALASLA